MRIKLLLLCLILSGLMFCATGCGNEQSGQKTQPERTLITVGFSQVGAESDWRIANTRSMMTALSS